MVAQSSNDKDYLCYALALEKAANAVGVNFIGGFSALVHKGYTVGDRRLIEAIPYALSQTETVCASVTLQLQNGH